MPTIEPTPIACTLGLEAMAQRLAWIRKVTAQNLLSFEMDARRLRLVYRRQAAEDLDQVVALERKCCAFLEFALERTLDTVELTILVRPGSDESAHWLFSQFLPQSASVSSPACACAKCS